MRNMTRDPRRSANVRTALVLAALALAFFVAVIFKYGVFAR